MLTHLNLTALRTFSGRENGDAASQFVWSVGVIGIAGFLALVVAPALGANWTEFVGNPTP